MKQDAAELNLFEISQKLSTPTKARKWFESVRWPKGPVCPHCGAKKDQITKTKAQKGSLNPSRPGLYRCRACDQQFTVTVGTIFEDSHIPLNKWMQAIFLMCSAKKGISSKQLERSLGVTYKTAWFMAHRIRHAMEDGPSGALLGGILEADEAYVGGKPRPKNNQKVGEASRGRPQTGPDAKAPVLALVQRGGDVRTKVVSKVTAANLAAFLDGNISRSAERVNTDQFVLYCSHFKSWMPFKHSMVNHSKKEYARREADGSMSHTNTVESFFSLLKRGVYGAFHHVSPEHLFRYCGEFAFRWNTRTLSDGERMERAFRATEGRRLTYKTII